MFLLPNILTCMTLFLGCYAMMKAIDGAFAWACTAVLLAMIFDFLDGRVARITNTVSEFGEQFDSLADLVAFGCAPAFIALEYHLRDMQDFWVALSFLWIGAVAVRLAKFNSQKQEKNTFCGMPCPSAAALLVGYVGCHVESPVFFDSLSPSLMILVMLVGSFAMVCRIPFANAKHLVLSKHCQYALLFLTLVLLSAMAIKPFLVLFLSSLSYLVVSIVSYVWSLRCR